MKAMNKENPKYNDCIERKSQLYERQGDFRTPFMRDYNRIIFTTAYRRFLILNLHVLSVLDMI